MKFHLVSDTHVDYHNPFPIVHDLDAEYALLAGDIGDPHKDSYREYLSLFSNKYKRVFVITGNHEYDKQKRGEFLETEQLIIDICNNFSNVTFLQKGVYENDDFRILGCTLWSDITPQASKMVNKFGLFDHVYDMQQLYYNHKQWLIDEIPKSTKPTIILVHHGPLVSMGGDFKDLGGGSAFTTDIPELFVSPVIVVCSGHVHSNVVTQYNNITSISNCLGYPWDKSEVVKYMPNLVLSLTNPN